MSISSLLSLLKHLDRRMWIFLAVAALGLLSLATGSYFTYETHFRHPQYTYLPVDEEWKQHLKQVVEVARAAEELPSAASVMVDVSGAVEKPGVYQLSTPARIQDAVLMAGGFQEAANQRFIHQELNLASQVQDQQKVYIPFAQESGVGVVAQAGSGTAGQATVNTATAAQLQEIDGVGEKRAETIVAGRPYSSKDDFFARAGLPQALAEAVLQELITFD